MNIHTFGIRDEDGHDGGAPVGHLDGEIPSLELVHADHLPRIGAAGQRKDHEAQEREKHRSPGHWRLAVARRKKRTAEKAQALNRAIQKGGQLRSCDIGRGWAASFLLQQDLFLNTVSV